MCEDERAHAQALELASEREKIVILDGTVNDLLMCRGGIQERLHVEGTELDTC